MARASGRRASNPLRNDARQLTPSGGTATNVACQRSPMARPGRLLRAGWTPGGSTNSTVRPGPWGTTVIVSSEPAATGATENADTAAGAAPGDGAVVRKTNGSGSRRHGTLPGGTSDTFVQPPGAPSPRSSPGSTDPTS